MSDEANLLNLRDFTLNSNGEEQQITDERISKIREFCKKVASTLRANEIGYIRDCDLGLHVL